MTVRLIPSPNLFVALYKSFTMIKIRTLITDSVVIGKGHRVLSEVEEIVYQQRLSNTVVYIS